MGIGIAGLRAVDNTGRGPLTTPHGDRAGGAGTAASAFRAHYPSWGSGSRLAELVAQVLLASLPLMGIGIFGVRLSHWTSPTSLPLMGIGILLWRPLGIYRRSPSLPLMGIGISGWRPSYKPPDRTRTHYPSWGSGSNIARGIMRGHRVGSLPLMGIGIPRPPGATISHAPTSLPLMGIGITRRRRNAPGRSSELTTPHGDRDPPAERAGAQGA